MPKISTLYLSLNPDAHPPQPLPGGGYGLCAIVPGRARPKEIISVPTGLTAQLPVGVMGLVYSEPDLVARLGIVVLGAPTLVMAGPIILTLLNQSRFDFRFKPGAQLARLILAREERAELELQQEGPK